MKDKAKLVGTVDICGLPFRVFESNPHIDNDLSDCYGYITNFNQEIHYQSAISREKLRDTLLHEGLHGIFATSGISNFLSGEMGITPQDSKFEKLEETFIRMLTPHLLRYLDSLAVLGAKK